MLIRESDITISEKGDGNKKKKKKKKNINETKNESKQAKISILVILPHDYIAKKISDARYQINKRSAHSMLYVIV